MQGDHKIIMHAAGRTTGTILFIIIAVSLTAGAEYGWTNNITIRTDGMQWRYTEHISGLDSYVFKYDADNKHGNFDRFVSAWELLKTDKYLRQKFRDNINRQMDVKFDNSSAGIEIAGIDARISEKALGPTQTETDFNNTYRVDYKFAEGLMVNSSSLWLMGEPGSDVEISFKEGTRILSVHGINNLSVHDSKIHGKFSRSLNLSAGGEAEITYQINQKAVNMSNEAENGNMADGTSTPTQAPFPGIGFTILIFTAVILLSKD